MDFDFSDLVGPFSALAAFVSAAIAYQANRNVAKSDRARPLAAKGYVCSAQQL